MAPAKLYRRTDDGLEYWESWVDDGGRAVVHSGRVGERGEVEELDQAEFTAYVARKTPELYAAGFRAIPDEEHAIVSVQWPRSALPEDTGALDELWDKIELWVNEELGWTGLGRCTGVDLSTELVALAEAVDADLAVKVLADSLAGGELPGGAVITVRDDDEHDVVRWPPERDGEDVTAGLPPG